MKQFHCFEGTINPVPYAYLFRAGNKKQETFITKSFNFKKYGGEDKAMIAAEEYKVNYCKMHNLSICEYEYKTDEIGQYVEMNFFNKFIVFVDYCHLEKALSVKWGLKNNKPYHTPRGNFLYLVDIIYEKYKVIGYRNGNNCDLRRRNVRLNLEGIWSKFLPILHEIVYKRCNKDSTCVSPLGSLQPLKNFIMYRKVAYRKSCQFCEATRPKNLEQHNIDRKRKLDELKLDLGGECEVCHTENLSVLEFNHLDPSIKLGIVGGFTGEKMLLEAKKCNLLCRICHRIETFKYKFNAKDNKTPKCKIISEYINTMKVKLGKCSLCGNSDYIQDYPYCYDFDHINPLEKNFTIGRAVSISLELETLQKEIDKCRLICANCHKVHTDQQIEKKQRDVWKGYVVR